MEKNIKTIPNEFSLGGTKFSVVTVRASEISHNVGQSSMAESKIYVANKYKDVICSNDYMEASFYHELVHAILDTIGKTELSGDETFVEAFANSLHQFIKTKK